MKVRYVQSWMESRRECKWLNQPGGAAFKPAQGVGLASDRNCSERFPQEIRLTTQ